MLIPFVMYKLQHLPDNYTLSKCCVFFENLIIGLIIGLMFSFVIIPVLMEMEWWRGAAPQQCPPAPGTDKDPAEPAQGGQGKAGLCKGGRRQAEAETGARHGSGTLAKIS